MNRMLMMSLLATSLVVGCGEDLLGTGGAGGTGVIGPLTWDVSEYMVGQDDCMVVTPTPEVALTTIEITISGSDLLLESNLENFFNNEPLGGTSTSYSATDSMVVASSSFMVTPQGAPECTVEIVDTFTLSLTNTSVSLDENETVTATWSHEETDTTDPACTEAIWGLPLPCASDATFTLTQQQQAQ